MQRANPARPHPRRLLDRPWTWIAFAALGFGGGFPLSKALLDSGVGVWQFFTPRYVLAVVIVLGFVTRRGLTDPVIRKRGALLGLLNVALTTVLLTFATDLLPASIAGILVAFVPVATVAFAHVIVPGERFVLDRIPGLTVAVIGAVILLSGSRTADGVALSVLGIALGILGVAAAGAGGALNRRYAMQSPALDLAATQFVVAAIALVIVSVPFGGLELGGFDAWQWSGLALMATFSTALPFYSILKAAESASAATVANVGYLAPVVSAVGSIAFLGDPVTGAFALGSVLIITGVWMSDRLATRVAAADR